MPVHPAGLPLPQFRQSAMGGHFHLPDFAWLLDDLGLVGWALAAGAASGTIYGVLRSGKELSSLDCALAGLRRTMVRYDGDFGGALLLIRLSFRLALRRVGLTLGPALIAGVPVLLVLTWTDVASTSEMWKSREGAVFLSAACLSALAAQSAFRVRSSWLRRHSLTSSSPAVVCNHAESEQRRH